MAESKYGNLILTGLIRDIPHYTGNSILAHDGELNTDCSMGYHCVSKPMAFDRPHAHDFAEMLCFIGGNPEDITDFGAEIEIWLGKEEEKQLINSSSVVYIPKGLVHRAVNFRKIDKPISFINIFLAPEYAKSWEAE